jgi:hypothetical protein
MNSDQARQQAAKRFKQEERARDGQKAMIEYEVQARATREKTARLKALRLAKEAQVQTEAPPAKQTIRRPRAPRKIAALQPCTRATLSTQPRHSPAQAK